MTDYPDNIPTEKFTDNDRELFKHYAAVFHGHSGKLVLDHLKKLCGIEFTGDPFDGAPMLCPIRMALNEGKRRIYWKIVLYIEMAKLIPPEE